MPPKIVYGKQKTATRTASSFAKLISENNPVASQRAGESAVAVSEDDWRQQRRPGAEEDVHEDRLKVLEKAFEGLRLEQSHFKHVGRTKKEHAPRTTAQHADRRENQLPADGTSDFEVETSALGRSKQTLQEMPVRKTRGSKWREPLKDRDAQPTTRAKIQVLQSRSVKGKGRQRNESPPSSPIRVRQATSRIDPKPSSPPPKPSLPARGLTPELDDIYYNYASPLLSMTETKRIKPFEEWSTELEALFDVVKIAEASFSEVYRLSTHTSSGSSGLESVLKLVALKTPPNIPLSCQSHSRTNRDRKGQTAKERSEREERDAWKSEVDDVVSEVKLLHNLAHIPGFTNFRDLTVLQGRPTPFFSEAWKSWNNSKARASKSEFPDPSKKTSYEETQLWAVIEMQDAGTDCEKLMENGGLSSIWEIWDVFWGVCLSVAKAEETCKFEHRDLHMGNICVRSSRAQGDVMDVLIEDPKHRKFRFTGLETTVIDYTLSRADILAPSSRRSYFTTVDTATSSSLNLRAEDVAYLDLDKDPALFTGDASMEYQYEIYRYMRGAALYNNPLQNNTEDLAPETHCSPRQNTHIRFDTHSPPRKPENVWSRFRPKTNLVWAHFLLHKLLTHLDSSANNPDKLSTMQIMADIKDAGVAPPKIKQKALRLHSVLKKVSELLCPVALGRKDSLGSVKDLVLLAIDQRWLRTRDVIG